MKHNRAELTTHFSTGSHWGDIFHPLFLLLFFVVCLPLFPSYFSHHSSNSTSPCPPHHVQNFKRQDQNNLHHTGNYRRRKMSHTVTARFFRGDNAVKWDWSVTACSKGLRAALVTWSSPSCFGKLHGHFVSLSGPNPHAVLRTLPTLYQNQENITPCFVHMWQRLLGQLVNDLPLLNCSMFSSFMDACYDE